MTTTHKDQGAAPAGGEVDVTFFVPSLNEGGRVVPTLESVRASMEDSRRTHEVIVVDGSSDRTAAVVEAMCWAPHSYGFGCQTDLLTHSHGMGRPTSRLRSPACTAKRGADRRSGRATCSPSRTAFLKLRSEGCCASSSATRQPPWIPLRRSS